MKDLLVAFRNYSPEGITAQGIETQGDLKIIQELGIHLAQGYLFGEPRKIA